MPIGHNMPHNASAAGGDMSSESRAGQLPQPGDLVDADALLAAYRERPPAAPVAFGTSGHRGTSLDGSFTEAHVAAITASVCRYRAQQGIAGPLFLGRDTHALSEPAFRTIVEVLAGHGVEVVIDAGDGFTPTPVISHAILGHNRGGGAGDAPTDRRHARRTTRPRTAASSTTRRTAGAPTPTSRPGSSASQPAARAGGSRRAAHVRSPRVRRRAPCYVSGYVDDLGP
jgi:hypothetical protein